MLFLERRETFSETARRFKLSRRAVQKHYRHHVEAILAQEPSTSTVANTPFPVVYAPTITNLVVLSGHTGEDSDEIIAPPPPGG